SAPTAATSALSSWPGGSFAQPSATSYRYPSVPNTTAMASPPLMGFALLSSAHPTIIRDSVGWAERQRSPSSKDAGHGSAQRQPQQDRAVAQFAAHRRARCTDIRG